MKILVCKASFEKEAPELVKQIRLDAAIVAALAVGFSTSL